jgi:hypothetical protein
MRYAYKVLVRRPKRKKPLGRFKSTSQDNNKTDLKYIKYEDADCIQLVQENVNRAK